MSFLACCVRLWQDQESTLLNFTILIFIHQNIDYRLRRFLPALMSRQAFAGMTTKVKINK